MLKKKIESLLFASGSGFKIDDLMQSFSGIHTEKEINSAINELKEQYQGDSGIILINYNDKYQFQTNPIYGEEISEILTPIKEKALSKTLLQVLSIIAYQQPITRLDIEDIRGTNADYACTILLKLNLIDIVGRKNTIGRPVLYATTEEFLRKFGLNSLDDLPDKEYLLNEIRNNFDKYYKESDTLYRHTTLEFNNESELEIKMLKDTDYSKNAIEKEKAAASRIDFEEIISDNELPDFLKGEDFIKID